MACTVKEVDFFSTDERFRITKKHYDKRHMEHAQPKCSV